MSKRTQCQRKLPLRPMEVENLEVVVICGSKHDLAVSRKCVCDCVRVCVRVCERERQKFCCKCSSRTNTQNFMKVYMLILSIN